MSWYQNDRTNHVKEDDPDSFEFVGGSIILRIKGVAETTLENCLDKQIELHRIDKLPKIKPMCKKCKTLLKACEHILWIHPTSNGDESPLIQHCGFFLMGFVFKPRRFGHL